MIFASCSALPTYRLLSAISNLQRSPFNRMNDLTRTSAFSCKSNQYCLAHRSDETYLAQESHAFVTRLLSAISCGALNALAVAGRSAFCSQRRSSQAQMSNGPKTSSSETNLSGLSALALAADVQRRNVGCFPQVNAHVLG